MKTLRCLALVPVVALFAGCTAGELVDQNFNPDKSGLPIFLVQVDANNKPIKSYGYTPGTLSEIVSFDPLAPTSSNVNGTGAANVSVELPTGNYYATIAVPTGYGTGWGYASSPVFHHDYYQSCTDSFTQKPNIPCAQYYFQVLGCATWSCVNAPGGAGDGTGSSSPATLTHGGWRVIQLLSVNASGGGPAGGPPSGVLQNNW